MSEIKEGQKWYIRFNRYTPTSTVKIVKIDGETVHFKPMRSQQGNILFRPEIATISDIEFIQQIEEFEW